jgi:phage protein D
MKFGEIEKKNLNFYAPRFQILVNETDILYKGVEIVSVTIDNRLEGPDGFSITINNPELEWLEDPLFNLGKEVEIRMGYAGELTPMILGNISAMEPTFSSSGPQQMVIRGFDLLKRLQRGERFRSWDEYKDSEIAAKIADEHHLLPDGIEQTDIEHPKIMQNGETDFSFLQKRAQDIGFEMFTHLRTFYFQKSKKNKDPITTLILGKTLTNFSPQLNLANKPSRVTVRGWNPREKKEIVGIAEKGQEADLEGERRSASQVIAKLYGSVEVGVRWPVYHKSQAEKRAMAILNASSDQFIKGNGTCVGIPEIRAGRYINIEGLGRLFSMKYYIESTTHKIDTSGYTTTFSVKGNAI